MGTVEILQGFFKCGAMAALVLDGNGQVLGEAYDKAFNPAPGLVEALKSDLSVAASIYACLNKGELERQQVHFADYQLHLESLGAERTLVLVLGAKANLGRIRLEIRKTRELLESEIEEG